MKKHIIILSAVLALAGTALAATTSSTEASLGVLPDCSVSATDIDMGIYNSRTGATGTGTVRVKCNTEFFVSYSGFTGNLKKGADLIPYTLTDAAYFQPIIGPKPIDQLDSAPISARWFDYGFLRPPNNQLADIPTPVNGFIHTLTATVAPGLWKPAGSYNEILTFTMEFPFNACVSFGFDC
jgi:hypothetical protein